MNWVGTASFGTTGSKTLLHGLGAVPSKIKVSVGARINTTETSAFGSEGVTDKTTTVSRAFAPSFTKRWPFSGESNYLLSFYTTSGNKVLSFTFTSTDDEELIINVDTANSSSSYPVTFELE